MKNLFSIFWLLLALNARATNYYFSDISGDDTRTSSQAQNPATPWKTITKLNSYFSSLAAGDSILFKCGETFVGSIVVNKSGTNGSRIVLGSYSTGARPVITGFSSITSWGLVTGNIYESTSAVSVLSTCNVISQGGISYAQARIPNTGYWSGYSTNGSTTITDAAHLNAAITNFTGADVVIRELMYEVNKHRITAASGTTITFDAGSVAANWGYFIQNDQRLIDQPGEWSFNYTTKKLSVYATSSPSNIKVPTYEEGANLNGKDYVTFYNLNFQGFNTTGINTNSRTGIRILNCDFSFIGVNGIYGYPNSNSLQVSFCSFTDCGSRAIHGGSSSSGIFSYNTLLRTGHFAGMGSNGDDSYTGIISNGDNSAVLYNSITNTGYCGIRWDGNSTLIKGNFVNTHNYIKDDGGGIYCYPVQFGNTPHTQTTRTIRDNVVINAVGAPDGSPYGKQAMAIYFDGQSPNIRCINNTVSGGVLGYFINGGHDIYIDSCISFDFNYGLYMLKIGGPIDNETVKHSVFAAKSGQYAAYYNPAAATMPVNAVIDSNCYMRPQDDNLTIVQIVSGNVNYKSLAGWKSATGFDAHSIVSPKAITNINDLRFEYNETGTNKVVSLGSTYIDQKGTSYAGAITLPPYSGSVLLKNAGANISPVANAGSDITITLPSSSVILNGSGIDPDGVISSFSWTKISGPVGNRIINPYTFTPQLTLLTKGIYVYRLTVTDNNGVTSSDDVKITVNGKQKKTIGTNTIYLNIQ